MPILCLGHSFHRQIERHRQIAHGAAGRSLGEGEHAVPVMLYGAAHPAGQTLASIRRAMNYFKGSSTGMKPAKFVCPASAPFFRRAVQCSRSTQQRG